MSPASRLNTYLWNKSIISSKMYNFYNIFLPLNNTIIYLLTIPLASVLHQTKAWSSVPDLGMTSMTNGAGLLLNNTQSINQHLNYENTDIKM